jgi:hypothetical protein
VARDIKDEQMPSPNGSAPVTQGVGAAPPGSILIPLDARLQRLAVNVALEDYESAKMARMEADYGKTSKGDTLNFDKWLKELTDLYFGQRIPKTIPWRFCSNRSLMIAMAIVETMVARLFPAVYNEDLVRWRPKEDFMAPKAESISKLMDWWVRVHVKMRDFFEVWTRYVVSFGRVLTESSWDVQLIDKGETSPSQPMMDEMGQSSMNPDGTPQIMGEEKVLERIEKTRSDIIPEEDIFLHSSATSIQRDPVIIRKKFLYRDLEELEREGKLQNVSQPSGDDPSMRTLKELLIVSGGSSGVSGVQSDEQEEIQAIRRRNVPVEIIEWWGGVDLDGDTFSEQVRLVVAPEHRVYLGGVQLKDISSRGVRPLDLTEYIPRVDQPGSLRAFGVLEQVKELAQEIDAIFNQMSDGNTLQVLKPGFFDPSGDLNVPNLTIAPNKWSPVSNPQQSIFVPEISIPTEKLIMAIKLVMEFIERLVAANSTIFGTDPSFVGGPGTATRTEATVGASNERNTIPAYRLREGAARIISQTLDLVQKNLPPGLEHRILGDKNEPVFDNPVTRESISGEYDAYLLPDDALGSKDAQRQLTNMLYQLLMQNPIVATDPAKIYKITADELKAYGKDPETYLGPEPPINDALSPMQENQLIMGGEFTRVKATVMQNPIEHIMEHQKLMQDPWILTQPPEVTSQILQYVQAHIMEHLQLMQTMIALSQQRKGGFPSAPNGSRAKGGGPGPAQAVGSEPGMGSLQSPLAAVGSAQRGRQGPPPPG